MTKYAKNEMVDGSKDHLRPEEDREAVAGDLEDVRKLTGRACQTTGLWPVTSSVSNIEPRDNQGVY